MGNGILPWGTDHIDKDIGETYASLYGEAYVAKDYKEANYWFKRLWDYGITIVTSLTEDGQIVIRPYTRRAHESYLRSRGKWSS